MERGGTDSCEVFEKSAEFLDSILVGGWTNMLKSYGSSPQGSGENKSVWNHHVAFHRDFSGWPLLNFLNKSMKILNPTHQDLKIHRFWTLNKNPPFVRHPGNHLNQPSTSMNWSSKCPNGGHQQPLLEFGSLNYPKKGHRIESPRMWIFQDAKKNYPFQRVPHVFFFLAASRLPQKNSQLRDQHLAATKINPTTSGRWNSWLVDRERFKWRTPCKSSRP